MKRKMFRLGLLVATIAFPLLVLNQTVNIEQGLKFSVAAGDVLIVTRTDSLRIRMSACSEFETVNEDEGRLRAEKSSEVPLDVYCLSSSYWQLEENFLAGRWKLIGADNLDIKIKIVTSSSGFIDTSRWQLDQETLALVVFVFLTVFSFTLWDSD